MDNDAAWADIERWYASPIAAPLRAAIDAHGDHWFGERVRLYAVDEIVERNETYQTQVYCPGYVTIGDDSGGRAFVVHGKLDPPTVFAVGHGSMSEIDFVEVGAELSRWISDGCPFG